MKAVLAESYIAACKLKKGEVKRLPLLGLKPLMLVVACPLCGWKLQACAPEHTISDQPLSLEPATKCVGCGKTYAIRNGEFELGGS